MVHYIDIIRFSVVFKKASTFITNTLCEKCKQQHGFYVIVFRLTRYQIDGEQKLPKINWIGK